MKENHTYNPDNYKNTRYKDDEEYRERFKKYSRERFQNYPYYKEVTLQRARRRYYDNKEYKKTQFTGQRNDTED